MASRCVGVCSYILQESAKEPACYFLDYAAIAVAGSQLLVKSEESTPPSLMQIQGGL